MDRLPMAAIATALAALMVAAGIGGYWLWLENPLIVEENHLLEWSQVVFLLLATAVHGVWMRRSAWRGEAALRLGLALLCLSMVLREVDIDRLGGASFMAAVEAALRGIVFAAWVLFGWYALRFVGIWWAQRVEMARSRLGTLTLVGCLLYATSWLFDKHPEHFGGSAARFFEETLQLNATIAMFVAAWFAVSSGLPQAQAGAMHTVQDDFAMH